MNLDPESPAALAIAFELRQLVGEWACIEPPVSLNEESPPVRRLQSLLVQVEDAGPDGVALLALSAAAYCGILVNVVAQLAADLPELGDDVPALLIEVNKRLPGAAF